MRYEILDIRSKTLLKLNEKAPAIYLNSIQNLIFQVVDFHLKRMSFH